MNATKLKIAAAAKALEFVKEGMILGIGTGSTANEFIRLLGAKVAKGFKILGVPTSEASAALCRELNIPLSTLDETPKLDLDIDGADEIGPNMALIKGGGGALLREKIVAYAAKSMIVIADETKLVRRLGMFPLPIEVNAFGLRATENAIKKVAVDLGLRDVLNLRGTEGGPFITDGGHFILDASFGHISNPEMLAEKMIAIPGVVEHGLFLNTAKQAVVAMENGTIKVFNVANFFAVVK